MYATLPSEADRTDETNRALEQKREMSAQIQEMQRRVDSEQTGEDHREQGLEKGGWLGDSATSLGFIGGAPNPTLREACRGPWTTS